MDTSVNCMFSQKETLRNAVLPSPVPQQAPLLGCWAHPIRQGVEVQWYQACSQADNGQSQQGWADFFPNFDHGDLLHFENISSGKRLSLVLFNKTPVTAARTKYLFYNVLYIWNNAIRIIFFGFVFAVKIIKSWLQWEKLQKFLCFLAREQWFSLCSLQRLVAYKVSHLGLWGPQ